MTGFAKLLSMFASRNLTSQAAVAEPAGASASGEYVDSRDCGLVDAVMSGWYLHDSAELLRGFAIGQQDTVLDFGCGEGGAALFAARQGAEVIFADTDAGKLAMLEASMREAHARAWRSVVCGDLCSGERLPLADGSVSKIIAMEVLEHVTEPAVVMAELVRVAAPGAQFLVSVPAPVSEALQKAIAPPVHFLAPNHIHIFTHEAFERLIVDSGLVIEQVHRSGFFWSLWMCFYWVSLRSSGGEVIGATRDAIVPPYPPLLDQWARTWRMLIDLPEGMALKHLLDELLPKSQAIIARKPL